MYQVCDSRQACSTVNGPNIKMAEYKMTENKFNETIAQIKASMERMEYDNAFRIALVAGISFKVFSFSQVNGNYRYFLFEFLEIREPNLFYSFTIEY